MSVTAWVIWFTALTIVLIAVLAIAMLGVTGRLTRSHQAEPSARRAPRHHHLHLPFRHHPAD